MVRVSSQGSCSVCCLKPRVKDSEVGPMPSLTMKIRFFLPSGMFAPLEAWPARECWYTTASTTTTAVASRAHAKRPISFQFLRAVPSCFPVCCPVRSASSSAIRSSLDSCDGGRLLAKRGSARGMLACTPVMKRSSRVCTSSRVYCYSKGEKDQECTEKRKRVRWFDESRGQITCLTRRSYRMFRGLSPGLASHVAECTLKLHRALVMTVTR